MFCNFDWQFTNKRKQILRPALRRSTNGCVLYDFWQKNFCLALNLIEIQNLTSKFAGNTERIFRENERNVNNFDVYEAFVATKYMVRARRTSKQRRGIHEVISRIMMMSISRGFSWMLRDEIMICRSENNESLIRRDFDVVKTNIEWRDEANVVKWEIFGEKKSGMGKFCWKFVEKVIFTFLNLQQLLIFEKNFMIFLSFEIIFEFFEENFKNFARFCCFNEQCGSATTALILALLHCATNSKDSAGVARHGASACHRKSWSFVNF